MQHYGLAKLIIARFSHRGHQIRQVVNSPEESGALLTGNPAQNEPKGLLNIFLLELSQDRHINMLTSEQKIRQVLLRIKI